MQLIQLGYDVVGSAVTGEEAIHMAASYRPDVVLMDVQLQGRMSGTAAATVIQSQNDVPIIFLTAFAGLLPQDPLAGTGYQMHLSKPFSMAELKDKLQQVLRGRRLG